MRALQSFHQENPRNFGAWFRLIITDRPLPWSWDAEEAALLLRWYHHFGWHQHLMDANPTPSGAGAALGTLLAQAYQSCFNGDGDTAVWMRLGQVMGIPDTSFGRHVTRLSQRLGLYQDSTSESDLIHVIPFLKLVGCPQQSLPVLGQQLRSSLPIGKRYRALVTAQWGPQAESLLKGWMKEGQSMPSFLSPAEGDLIQRDPETKKADLGFQWTVFELASGAYQLSLVPTKSLAQGDWVGSSRQSVSSEIAKTYGIPQELGRDGLVQGPGQTLDIDWPSRPSFWSVTKPTPRGVKQVFEKTKGIKPTLVCLPPQWSLDGDPEPGWRWQSIKGQTTLFDPSGTPWQAREESATWDALDGISLLDHPHIAVLHKFPEDLPGLEVLGGRLGSTLQEGVAWKRDQFALPPLGHLRLSWLTKHGHRRQKEVYFLPTLQLTKSTAERPVVWIRGMEGLVDRENENRWYELAIEPKASQWLATIAFKGWGSAPVQLCLEGRLTRWGAFLSGWRSHHPWTSHGPWHVGPRFPMEVYEANLRIEVALPTEVEGRMWLDGTAPLWEERTIKHQRKLGPLEFHDPLKPLWGVVEPMGRPVRIHLAWPNPADQEAEKLKSVPVLRFFPRDAPLSVKSLGAWKFHIRSHSNEGSELCLEDWDFRIRSTKNPGSTFRENLAALKVQRTSDGVMVEIPAFDPGDGPYHIGVRDDRSFGHPISIHVDKHGNPIARAVEAHCKAVRGRMIGGVAIREDLPDSRDQLLAFAYDLAESQNLLELLERDEIDHWLDYLSDDFVFSQPWTLGIALRHPKMTLKHIARANWGDEERLQSLGNLGQSGWSWWLVPPADLETMDPELRSIILQSASTLARRRITALHGITNPAVRTSAVARLCEEGLFLVLEPTVRRLYLEQMGFPVDLMEKPWNANALAARICQQQDDFLGGHIQRILHPSPEPPPMLPKPPATGLLGLPPVLDRITRLSGWGRAYRQWASEESGSLISAPHWHKATPEVFRHYGPLFTFFALLNWQD
jgi:hypothetical protein